MKSVLIAEDNRDLAATLREALEPLDLEVRLAYDGQAAVHAPQIGKPRRIEAFAPFGRRAQGFGRLPHVVLEQPRFGQPQAVPARMKEITIPGPA